MIIDSLKDIGKLVAELRRNENISGEKFAEKMASTQPFVSRLERGKINVTINMLIRIARACGKRIYISIK